MILSDFMDLLILEPGYTSFYRKAQVDPVFEYKRKALDSNMVEKMEVQVSEIYSPDAAQDNFYFTAKL